MSLLGNILDALFSESNQGQGIGHTGFGPSRPLGESDQGLAVFSFVAFTKMPPECVLGRIAPKHIPAFYYSAVQIAPERQRQPAAPAFARSGRLSAGQTIAFPNTNSIDYISRWRYFSSCSHEEIFRGTEFYLCSISESCFVMAYMPFFSATPFSECIFSEPLNRQFALRLAKDCLMYRLDFSDTQTVGKISQYYSRHVSDCWASESWGVNKLYVQFVTQTPR